MNKDTLFGIVGLIGSGIIGGSIGYYYGGDQYDESLKERNAKELAYLSNKKADISHENTLLQQENSKLKKEYKEFKHKLDPELESKYQKRIKDLESANRECSASNADLAKQLEEAKKAAKRAVDEVRKETKDRRIRVMDYYDTSRLILLSDIVGCDDYFSELKMSNGKTIRLSDESYEKVMSLLDI